MSYARGEKSGFKKVNIYQTVKAEDKKRIKAFFKNTNTMKCLMHEFSGEDFKNMTSMDVWWEDWVSFNFSNNLQLIFIF